MSIIGHAFGNNRHHCVNSVLSMGLVSYYSKSLIFDSLAHGDLPPVIKQLPDLLLPAWNEVDGYLLYINASDVVLEELLLQDS